MNFFGLTYLGSEYTLGPYLRSSLSLADLSDEHLIAAFSAFSSAHKKAGLLGSDDIRPLLIQAYGREPPELEVAAFLRAFTANGRTLPSALGLTASGRYVDEATFATVVLPAVRKEMSEVDMRAATEFTSHQTMRASLDKGTGVVHGPHNKYRTPATTSQEYGWHTPMPFEQVPRHPMKSCAETTFASEMVKSGQF